MKIDAAGVELNREMSMGNNKAGWILGGFVFILGISVEVAFEEAGGTPLPIQLLLGAGLIYAAYLTQKKDG